MTNWKLKLTSYLYALPWRGLGQIIDERGIPEVLISTLQLGKEELTKAASVVATARGLVPNEEKWHEFFNNPVIKHTLSGRTKLLEISKEDGVTLGNTVIQEVLKLADCYSVSAVPKQLYLAVWRLLPEKVSAICGSNAALFPAFSQMPDRSMWEQAQLAAAFSTTYDAEQQACRPTLFSFSLGSVQEYVFTARRTQDFWAGSFTQSFVIWHAIKVLAEKYGPDVLIYPDLHNQPLVDLWLKEEQVLITEPIMSAKLSAGFPNVFTVILPQTAGQSVGQDVQSALCQVRDEMFGAVDELMQQAFQGDERLHYKLDKVTRDIKNHTVKAAVTQALTSLQSGTKLSQTWHDIWERQRQHFLSEDCFYVAVPWVNDQAVEPLGWLYGQYEKYLPQGLQEQSAYEDCRKLAESICSGASDAEKVGFLYQPAGALAGRMLVAGKNLRYFEQSVEAGCKCSLCGNRQGLTVVSKGNSIDELIVRKLWQLMGMLEGKTIRMTVHLKNSEHLCSVCLVKRLAYTAYFRKQLDIKEQSGLFPSVSSIANAACKQGILAAISTSPAVYSAVCDYVQTISELLKKYQISSGGNPLPLLVATVQEIHDPQNVLPDFIRLDGCLLYEESFVTETFAKEIPGFLVEKTEIESLAEECQLASMTLKELLNASREYNKNNPTAAQIPLPSKYYAVMYMDGDKMGEWVQGRRNPTCQELLMTSQVLPEKLQQLKRPMEPIVHVSISKALKNFSQILVPKIVETDYPAKLVYAGGDDVMALVPMHSCLDMISAVRQAFSGEGQEAGQQGWQRQNDEVLLVMDAQTDKRIPGMNELRRAASASCGVVIAHHSQPLQQVLDKVASVLKNQAKDVLERDAFAVLVDKRGGEPLLAGAKWRSGDLDIPALITKLNTYWQQGLSPALVYHMEQEKDGLEGIGIANDKKKAREQQLLCQQGRLNWLIDRHSVGMTEESRSAVKTALGNLLSVLEEDSPWQQIVNILLLSRFISRGGDE